MHVVVDDLGMGVCFDICGFGMWLVDVCGYGKLVVDVFGPEEGEYFDVCGLEMWLVFLFCCY